MLPGIGAIGGQFPLADGAARIGGGGSTAASIGDTFASLLSQAASNTVDTLQHAETVSVQALSGDAETRDVVDAVMNAEQSLQAAIAIRDKIVTAYLEISRMSI